MKFLKNFTRQIELNKMNLYLQKVTDLIQGENINIEAIIKAINPLYKRSAIDLREQLSLPSSELDIDIANHSLTIFRKTTLIAYYIFEQLADFEAKKKLIDFYFEITNNSRVKYSPIMGKLQNETLLRQTILDIEQKKDKSMIDNNLATIQNYLFSQINGKTIVEEVLGEMALYYFVIRRQEKSSEYLQMYYNISQDKSVSIIASEIRLNSKFESSIMRDYISFVQNFVEEKKLLAEKEDSHKLKY